MELEGMSIRSVTEAARLLGVTRYRLLEGIKAGRYPAMRFEGRLMVDIDALREIIRKEDQQRAKDAGRKLNLKQCAAAIGLSTGTLRRMAEAGAVPGSKRGRYWMFDLNAVKAAINKNMGKGL